MNLNLVQFKLELAQHCRLPSSYLIVLLLNDDLCSHLHLLLGLFDLLLGVEVFVFLGLLLVLIRVELVPLVIVLIPPVAVLVLMVVEEKYN